MYTQTMQIFIGADHGGFELKETLKKLAKTQPEITFEDIGALTLDPTDDYPAFGFSVAQKVAAAAEPFDADPTTWGVLICRSGGGISIAANRVPKVRAVVCRTVADVDHARRHNNANVIVLEGDHIGPDAAWRCLQTFLSTPFDGGRHATRVTALG
jgi:ribose 5-phosphate isomerase B